MTRLENSLLLLRILEYGGIFIHYMQCESDGG